MKLRAAAPVHVIFAPISIRPAAYAVEARKSLPGPSGPYHKLTDGTEVSSAL